MPAAASPRPRVSPGVSLHKPKDWATFERLCVDLYAELLDYVHTERNGRDGQRQHGIDLYGMDRRSGDMVGVQCKKCDERSYPRHAGLTVAELDAAVAGARSFRPHLSELVIPTTGPNDAKTQEYARSLSAPDDSGHAMRIIVHLHGTAGRRCCGDWQCGSDAAVRTVFDPEQTARFRKRVGQCE